MEIIAYQPIDIRTLKLPDDYPAAARSPQVKILVESIREHGLIEPILVSEKTRRLVCGRKRVAAHRILQLTYIPGALARFEDALEEEIIVLRENLDREEYDQKTKDRMRVELVALIEKRIAAKEETQGKVDVTDEDHSDHETRDIMSQVSAPPWRGPKRSSASKARTAAAEQLGVSEKTIRRAEKKAAGGDDEAAPDAAPAAAIEMHGYELPAAAMAAVADAVKAFDDAEAGVKRAMSALKHLGSSETYVRARYQKVYGELKHASQLIRANRPASVCLDCKGIAKYRNNCARCMGHGYVVEEQLSEFAAEVKRTGKAAGVFVDGKFRLLAADGK